MIRQGTKVKWKWGNGVATGKVIDIYEKSITKQINGKEITRNGNKENKAIYLY